MIGFYFCVPCAARNEPSIWSPYFNDFFLLQSYVEFFDKNTPLPVHICPKHGGIIDSRLMLEVAGI